MNITVAVNEVDVSAAKLIQNMSIEDAFSLFTATANRLTETFDYSQIRVATAQMADNLSERALNVLSQLLAVHHCNLVNEHLENSNGR